MFSPQIDMHAATITDKSQGKSNPPTTVATKSELPGHSNDLTV